MNKELETLIEALRGIGLTISPNVRTMRELIIAVESSSGLNDGGDQTDGGLPDLPDDGPMLMSATRSPRARSITNFMCDGLPASRRPGRR